MTQRNLLFVEPQLADYAAAIRQTAAGAPAAVFLSPEGRTAQILRAHLTEPNGALAGASVQIRDDLPAAGAVQADGPQAICVLLPRDDAADLAEDIAARLQRFVDWDGGTVIAPVTPRLGSRNPIFLVSIPKSGTHLMHRLVDRLGYYRGVELRGFAKPAHWYCLEYSNSHTAAADFFVDSVRRGPFGLRAHPFPRTPTLFIYRNPLDIWVSEANYYHEEGKTLFAGYLSALDFEGRLARLLDDPWLLGSLRQRIGGFLPWLDFPNVLPVSYEELVGARGGGSDKAQHDLIWSLQLKLHIPGRPERIAEGIYDGESPTFHRGTIGAYRDLVPQRLFDAFARLDRDFMQALGYDGSDLQSAPFPPARAEEFRRRPMALARIDFDETPMELGMRMHSHIVQYRGRFYAVPQRIWPLDFSRVTPEALATLQSADTVTELRDKVLLGPLAYLQALQRASGWGDARELGNPHRGFRHVAAGGRFYGLSPDCGTVDFDSAQQLADAQAHGRLVGADSIDGVKAGVDHLLDMRALQARIEALEAQLARAEFRP